MKGFYSKSVFLRNIDYKKLDAVGKKKSELCVCGPDQLANHTYWCAMSSNGDGELVLQKWCSIFNPDANVHEGHGPSFPNCEHGNSEDRDWIRQGI